MLVHMLVYIRTCLNMQKETHTRTHTHTHTHTHTPYEVTSNVNVYSRKSQCTGVNSKERGGATTADHKRKLNHPVTTHNSKIPVAKSAAKKTMTAKDFDRIHQKNFKKSVVIHTHLNCVHLRAYACIRLLYIRVYVCVCKNLCTCTYACRSGWYIFTGIYIPVILFIHGIEPIPNKQYTDCLQCLMVRMMM